MEKDAFLRSGSEPKRPGTEGADATVARTLPRMVAVGRWPPTDYRSPNPDAAGPRSPNYVGALYNPRRQGAIGREQWKEDVWESARKSEIPTSTLSNPPPTLESVTLDNPSIDQKDIEDKYYEALALYQVRNTQLWDLVRPSLDISGALEEDDREHFRTTFMVGDLRDGYGLYQWALDHGTSTDMKSQLAISDDLAKWPMLSATASRLELVTHTSSLLRLLRSMAYVQQQRCDATY